MKEALATMTHDQLHERLRQLADSERTATADVIAHLAEAQRRKTPEYKGFPGLFEYCVHALGYTEDEAYRRMTAAQLVVHYPYALTLLESGAVRLTTLRLIGPHLNFDNHRDLLDRCKGLSRLQTERLIASLHPRGDITDHVQRLPQSTTPAISFTPSGTEVARIVSSPPEKAQPIAPRRVHFGFTGSEELHEKIMRAKKLLWHKFPHGRLEDIFSQAIDDLLEKRDPERRAERAQRRKRRAAAKLQPDSVEQAQPSDDRSRPAASSRYIPADVRAEVWTRDEGRCAFTTSDGVRCAATGALEYDHVVPYARGGASDDPGNVRLLCRAHNQLAAVESFGEDAARQRGSPPA